MKVIWLCSWYPHPGNPFEGDFIQRHARAVTGFMPVTVFYVNQDGIGHSVESTTITDKEVNGVREKIISFKFRKTGIKVIDKLGYNLRYFSIYKKYIRQYIVQEGKPDLVHIHVPMKAGMVGKWLRKNWKIPYILSEHSSHYNGGTDDDFFARSSFHQRRVKSIFRNAVAVTNVSAVIGKRLEELFEVKDVRIIRNTVDTTLFYYKQQPVAKFRFIHVSTLVAYQKNIEGIINAVLALSKIRDDFELLIVGPASDELMSRVSKAGLDSLVKFTGEISYPAVALQMQEASAFVLFSRFENFPCVVIEALCCGLPVIAADTGGISEAINESNGILVQSEKEEQLVHAMERMINDYQYYNRQKISDEATAQYSYAAIGSAFSRLYDELAAKKKIK